MTDLKETEQFLAVWRRDVLNSGIKVLRKMGQILAGYRDGLLNYFDRPIAGGSVGGLMNTINTPMVSAGRFNFAPEAGNSLAGSRIAGDKQL